VKKLFFVTVLVLFGLALGAAYLLDRYAPHLRAADERSGAELAGSLTCDAPEGDVLLVLDSEEIARTSRAHSFRAQDWSCAWLNLLHQEVGPIATCEVGEFGRAMVEPRRLVIITRSARATVGVGEGVILETYLRGGGRVAIEWPGEKILPMAGLRASGDPEILTGLEWLAAEPPIAAREKQALLLLRAGLLRLPVAVESTEVVVRAWLGDDRKKMPIVTERPIGNGRLISVLLDVGRALVANQQGTPVTDRYEVSERHGDYPDILEPDDLVADPALRDNLVPHVDIFEELVFGLLQRPSGADGAPPPLASLPIIGRTPMGARGLFAMTHDEDMQGDDKCRAIVQATKAAGGKSTVLVIPHPRVADLWSPASVRSLVDAGAEIGLHWNQYPMPWGWGKFEPISKVFSLSSQVAMWRPYLPGALVSNRNHYLIWTRDWAQAFRLLAAQGIAIDSTYGSNKGRGYLFGTGSPFLAIDDNGLPLPIQEVPFLNQETWGKADLAFFEKVLGDNADRYHGCYVGIFHPHLDFKADSIGGMKGAEFYARVIALAKERGYRFVTLSELDQLERSRWQARITSRWNDNQLSADVDVPADGLALYLPLCGGKPKVTRSGSPVEGQEILQGEMTYLAVPLAAGRNAIVAEYARR
jgi:hypothetical protein